MSAALAEPIDPITATSNNGTDARAEASRANGRLSRGPITPEGKSRSRRNGCKDGLTGKGIVLPPTAAAEVDRREAEFARDLRPKSAVERELVRQMALGSWRSHELGMRIIHHDARTNTARFANWEQDQRIAAAEIGRRLGDDPETAVAQLQRSSVGCDWLIVRWRLLENALLAADLGGPGCTWTDADLALALNLLGRPAELRHLDDWAGRLQSLRAEAESGSQGAVTELREIIAEQVAELEKKSDEAWEGVEVPLLRDWHAGLEIDLGPEGTRLRRYEAAADRLFRSAWTKLERLRSESGDPMIHCSAPISAAEPATPPSPAPASAPMRRVADVLGPLLQDDPSAEALDLWIAGRPKGGLSAGFASQNKTNPAPGRSKNGARAARAGNRP
jgi:hypothetical protein